MFRRAIRQLSRKSGPALRKFALEPQQSDSNVETWVKIYREMRHEAREIADNTIASRTAHLDSEISGIKSEISVIKSDINGIKSDINGIKSDIKDLYKQSTNTARMILAGMFGITSAGVAVNQFFDNKRELIVREQHNSHKP